MNFFYLDASALGRRYALEMGTALINRLFDSIAKDRLMALSISIGEMMSIIVRRHNAGFISDERFAQASAEFKTEIVDADDFRLEPVEDALIRTSLDLSNNMRSTPRMPSCYARRWMWRVFCMEPAITWCLSPPIPVFSAPRRRKA